MLLLFYSQYFLVYSLFFCYDVKYEWIIHSTPPSSPYYNCSFSSSKLGKLSFMLSVSCACSSTSLPESLLQSPASQYYLYLEQCFSRYQTRQHLLPNVDAPQWCHHLHLLSSRSISARPAYDSILPHPYSGNITTKPTHLTSILFTPPHLIGNTRKVRMIQFKLFLLGMTQFHGLPFFIRLVVTSYHDLRTNSLDFETRW